MTQWKNGMLGEIEDDDGNNIAVVNLSAPDAMRNLAMMTAAPELLEVVRAMANFDGRNNNAALKQMARDAVAKAEGRK